MLTGYYQKKNRKRLQKSLVNSIKIFLKKKEIKSISMVVNNIEIFQKIKHKD